MSKAIIPGAATAGGSFSAVVGMTGCIHGLTFCYLGANGVPGKPFLLPQKETDYYERSLFSFNIPEFIRGKIKVDTYKLIDISKYGEAVRLK